MFFYFGTRYKSETVGTRLVGVKCDKCRNEYCYELSRIGDGEASAHYGIGSEFAANKAAAMAEADLMAQLESEADLIPCPNCNWINEDQVVIYRNSRYQGLVGCFGVLAVFGAFLAVIVAFVVIGIPENIGDVFNQGIAPFFVFAIPAVLIVLAVFMFPLRTWLRSRINPNENPVLPPGTPSAMYYDEETDTLTPAKTKRR